VISTCEDSYDKRDCDDLLFVISSGSDYVVDIIPGGAGLPRDLDRTHALSTITIPAAGLGSLDDVETELLLLDTYVTGSSGAAAGADSANDEEEG